MLVIEHSTAGHPLAVGKHMATRPTALAILLAWHRLHTRAG